MTLKKAIGKIHLWLGLTSGLVVFVIALTGCIYTFQNEIQDLTQPYRFTESKNQKILPPSILKSAAEKELPGKHIHAVFYQEERSAQVIFYHPEPEHYYLVYINPYTAEVLNVTDMSSNFFNFILQGHFYLWLPHDIGQTVVASATLIFIFMLISGIIMWWPKKNKNIKQRITIKFNSRWRRVNYDLHRVMGFYVWSVAMILALTGLVWGFEWFANGWYATAGGNKSLQYSEPLSDTSAVYKHKSPSIDQVYAKMVQAYPAAKSIEVHIPETTSSPVSANSNSENGTYWKLDYRYYDQYTLKELPVDHIYGRIHQADAGDKLLRMNYDIHTGAILGLPGKILVFFAGLICASLPVTGFCIWMGRRKKKKSDEYTEYRFHKEPAIEEFAEAQ
jgi:uncharacterized iron-regulated membrane protein